MNREIKFRAWDNQNNKMIYPGSKTNDTFLVFEETGWFVVDHFTGKHETILKSEDGILMQYTGLKDKNGKEIYEGDILGFKEKNYFSNEPVVVKYGGGSFVVYNPNCCDVCKNSGGCISTLDECLYMSQCAEVIGNIYENPEVFTKPRKRIK
jgi:uncharacterized phage protein (TIGR01671 family)